VCQVANTRSGVVAAAHFGFFAVSDIGTRVRAAKPVTLAGSVVNLALPTQSDEDQESARESHDRVDHHGDDMNVGSASQHLSSKTRDKRAEERASNDQSKLASCIALFASLGQNR